MAVIQSPLFACCVDLRKQAGIAHPEARLERYLHTLRLGMRQRVILGDGQGRAGLRIAPAHLEAP